MKLSRSMLKDRVTVFARDTVVRNAEVEKTAPVPIARGVRCSLHTVAPKRVRVLLGADSFDSPTGLFGREPRIRNQYQIRTETGLRRVYTVKSVFSFPNESRPDLQVVEFEKEAV